MDQHQAYKAGWDASRRTTTANLEAAEQRFERKHGSCFAMDFVRGWTDYASGASYAPIER